VTTFDASIFNELVAGGLTPIAAAGVMGNLQQESDTNLTEPGGLIAQWGGARLTAESAYAKSVGLSSTSQQSEIGYLLDELHGGPGSAENDSSVLTAINKATSPSQAALIFSQGYERPGIPDNPNREQYANDAYAVASKLKSVAGSWTLPTGSAPINIDPGGVAARADTAVTSAASDATGLASFLGKLTDPSTWLRVAAIVGAGVLLIIGMIELAGGHPATDVVKGVSTAAMA
jgi:hypothetical protein